MHEQWVAHVDVSGVARRRYDLPPECRVRDPLADFLEGQTTLSERLQHGRHVEVGAAEEKGRGVVHGHLAEEEKDEKPFPFAVHVVVPRVPRSVGAVDVPLRLQRIDVARKSGEDVPANSFWVPPSARPEQLVIRAGQPRRGSRNDERASVGTRKPHEGLGPCLGVVFERAVLRELRPDKGPAVICDIRIEPSLDLDESVGLEASNALAAEHRRTITHELRLGNQAPAFREQAGLASCRRDVLPARNLPARS